MKQKLVKNNADELIIFLSGWGCDDIQFKNMKSSKDVLICWDYTNFDSSFNYDGYKKYYLIAYSAGVFVAGIIQDKLPEFELKIAINGNPLITDEYFGIPKYIRQIFKDLNINNYMDFRKEYLVMDGKELDYFNQNASGRTFESCLEEINKLEEFAAKNKNVMDFDIAILSDNDKIFTPSHQLEYFNGRYKLLKDSAHNVFYSFRNFDDFIIKEHMV